jgi:hypothetical protein
LRQHPDRYAFRAGRNLPDKEFRYLRTVIVTAAVYWGFSSELAPFPLTFQHRAGVSPYTSDCSFAWTCVFAKQSPGSIHCGSLGLHMFTFHPNRAPLLPKLRGHFAEFLNKSSLARLRFLTLPTCVGLRYGHLYYSLAAFLGSGGSTTSVLNFPPHRISGLYKSRICLTLSLLT